MNGVANLSAPGALLFGNSSMSLANAETENERKKRLLEIQNAQQATQARLGTTPGSNLSAPSRLLGFNGYSGI